MQPSPIQLSAQENEYWFPYHYVAMMPEQGFRQHFVDSWGINYITTIDWILSKIADQSPRSILDIGCGDGRLTREIHLRFPQAIAVGVDFSARAITLASAMNQDLPGIDFRNVDITQTDIPEKYDSAVLMEVLEHIPIEAADQFLFSVRRTLKPGGLLFLTVPHANKPVEYKHFQHFTVESIRRHLEPFFNILQIMPFERKSYSRRLMADLLCNRFFILNSGAALNWIYNFHRSYLFHCTCEQECQRIFVLAEAREP